MTRLRLLLLACVSLSARAPFIPVVNMGDLSTEQRAAVASVRIYGANELRVLRHAPLGAIEGFSCKELLWSPEATQEDAIQQLKHWAAQKGANGIADLKCDPKEGVSFATNCWETIRCTAQALKVNK